MWVVEHFNTSWRSIQGKRKEGPHVRYTARWITPSENVEGVDERLDLLLVQLHIEEWMAILYCTTAQLLNIRGPLNVSRTTPRIRKKHHTTDT